MSQNRPIARRADQVNSPLANVLVGQSVTQAPLLRLVSSPLPASGC